MRGRPNKEEKYHNYISQLEAKEKRESFQQIFFLCILATVGLGAFLLFQMSSNSSEALVHQDYQLRPEPGNISKTETSFDTEDTKVIDLGEVQSDIFEEGYVVENKSYNSNEEGKRDSRRTKNERTTTLAKEVSSLDKGKKKDDDVILEGEGVTDSMGKMDDKLDEDANNVESNLGKTPTPNNNETIESSEDKSETSAPRMNVKAETPVGNSIDTKNTSESKPISKASKSVGPQALAEKMPQFPGGVSAMNKFLSKRINYPLAAKDHKIQGKVYLQFVVETDGSLTNMKVARGLGYGCDEEAVRVARKMPKWVPGEDKGRKIPVIYTLAVQFRIQ